MNLIKREITKEELEAEVRIHSKALELAKQKLKEIEEEKPWSPKGQGGYVLDADGGILSNACLVRHQKFGTQGTKEQMENLRNPMMHLGSEHAWARERDGVQPFCCHEQNWHVVYDADIDKFTVHYNTCFKSQTVIYMTEQDARAYADMMNKGLIAFPYEVK